LRSGFGERTAQSGTPAPRRIAAKKVLRFAGAVLLVVMLGIVANEVWVRADAAEVAASVPTRELEQLGDVWDRYDDLSRRSYLQIATLGLGRSLTQRSADLADRVIANYRTSLPTVREAQWRSARDALARAVAVTPHDKQLNAALR
jgi:hypothetical protein